LPQNWIIGNYFEVFSFMRVAGFGYFGMLFNSIYFSVVGSLIKVMVTSIFAYTCTKYKFPGSTLVYPIIMIMLTLPIYGAQGSQYIIIKRLGLINSYSQIILAINGMNMWFLYFTATFKGVSDTYGEAAVIDGANDFQVYFKVMLPQAFNLWLAMFLMSWEADWNNYSSVLLYLPKLPTLAGGLYMFEIDAVQSVRFDMLYAAYSLSALPPLIIFAFFSNILTNSISIGGVKE
jgi:ABC-type glycerol-3-phosphate transport system permease component